MNSENTTQVKAYIIQHINLYKEDAIKLGFDYPTENLDENLKIEVLVNFLEELVGYIAYNTGFNDGCRGEESLDMQDVVTH